MEFIGFVFKFFLILGNEFLYVRLLLFIPVKSYLAGCECFIYFFKPIPVGKHFPFKFPYHCLQSLDCFLCLFRIFGQFSDIIAFTKMANVPAFNTITTFQSVLTTYLFIK